MSVSCILLNDANALKISTGGDLCILSQLPELILVNGLVLVSRGNVGGGEVGIDSQADLPDSRLELCLHLLLLLLLLLADDGYPAAGLGHVWWWFHYGFPLPA